MGGSESSVFSSTAKVVGSAKDGCIAIDRQIKNVLACKPILACIFRETVTECKGMSIEDIIPCIEGTPEIESEVVSAGYGSISGLGQEDSDYTDDVIKYDIRTYIRVPGKDAATVKIYIDLEAQKDDKPGYDITERAIFYACRMISSQLGVEFMNSGAGSDQYGNIKKVYSIWICTNTAEKRANSVDRYHFTRETIIGHNDDHPRYDLAEVVIVNVGHKHIADFMLDSDMLNMLNGILATDATGKDRIDALESAGIQVTYEVEKEVGSMGSIAAGWMEDWMKQGLEKGFEKGREQGLEKGLEQGQERARVEAAMNSIQCDLEDGVPRATIIKRAVRISGLPEDRVNELYTDVTE